MINTKFLTISLLAFGLISVLATPVSVERAVLDDDLDALDVSNETNLLATRQAYPNSQVTYWMDINFGGNSRAAVAPVNECRKGHYTVSPQQTRD